MEALAQPILEATTVDIDLCVTALTHVGIYACHVHVHYIFFYYYSMIMLSSSFSQFGIIYVYIMVTAIKTIYL